MNIISVLEEKELLKRDQNRCLEMARQMNRVNTKVKGDLWFMEDIKETERKRMCDKMIAFIDENDIDDTEMQYILRQFVQFIIK